VEHIGLHFVNKASHEKNGLRADVSERNLSQYRPLGQQTSHFPFQVSSDQDDERSLRQGPAEVRNQVQTVSSRSIELIGDSTAVEDYSHGNGPSSSYAPQEGHSVHIFDQIRGRPVKSLYRSTACLVILSPTSLANQYFTKVLQ